MRSVFPVAVAIAGISTLFAGCEITKTESQTQSQTDIDTRPSFAVRTAVERVSPAVVQLDVVIENFRNGQLRPESAIGSGVIIDKQGHVLTNFHVAGRAKRITITLADQEHVRATLVGSDHWTDLAVVQLDMDEIKRKGLTFSSATLGDSSKVMLGQPVMAVGTPYGLSRTLTAGIVSQGDRYFDESNIDGYETGWFNNWIQTDAAINPGNSGGPLIDLKGEVVGINTRGISEGNNLGFAIPIDTAKEVVTKILNSNNKKVARSYIGLTLQPLQDLEKYYDLESNKGVLVRSVEKDSPAEKAGLKAEDILLSVNGTAVNARFPEQLAAARKLIADFPIGTKLDLVVRRGNASSIAATLAPARAVVTTSPATLPASAPTSPVLARGESQNISVTTDKLESAVTEEKSIAAWGLTVRDLTRAYLRNAHLAQTQGVLVTGARVGSPADRAKIGVGDIILRVADKPVTSTEELETAVATWEKDPQPVFVDITRDRGQITQVIRKQ